MTELTYPGDNGRVYPNLSHAMADVLCGTHSLKGMEHGSRVEFLFGLQVLMDATYKVGWAEHTNDWDWSVQVTTQDGETHGASFTEPYVNCDTFRLLVELDQGQLGYSATHEDIKWLTLIDVEPLAGREPRDVNVFIDRIATIHIEES